MNEISYIFHRGFRKKICLSICVNGIKKGGFSLIPCWNRPKKL